MEDHFAVDHTARDDGKGHGYLGPMASKKHVGQLISLHLRNRATPISGFVLGYNDEWTLLRYRPVDYVLDGYVIVRHKYIKGYTQGDRENFAERVIRKKGYAPEKKGIISLGTLERMLRKVTARHGVFQAELEHEDSCYIGAFLRKKGNDLVYTPLSPSAEWEREDKLKENRIRVVHFGTDYCDSLVLMAGERKKDTGVRRARRVS